MLSTTCAVDIKRYEALSGYVCGKGHNPIKCVNILELRCCAFGPTVAATWTVEFQLVAPGNVGNWFKPSPGSPWISSRESAESAIINGELIGGAADQSAAETSDIFPWINSRAARDDEDVINERDAPTSTVPSDSFSWPWITGRDYDEEVNERDTQTSTEFNDSFPWIED